MADEKLGKYEIRGTLGRGAMGTVYDGWDPLIARRVAIKTVRLPQGADSEAQEELARFRREAQAAGRLNHPNIVGVFDYGETDEVAYIVMEFVDGRTLKALIDAGERMAPAAIGRCMEDILAGLQYSHDRGVVHRDIKPANIMFTHDGRAKIADFGIARIESSSLTQAGTLLGTPAYMSPEQFMGQVVDLRTDIYSSGILLYQLLTGERPFEGSMTGIMHKVLNTVPPRPSELSVTCPPGFDDVVGKAMAKRPDDRFPNARAFADAIHAAIALPFAASAPDPLFGLGDVEATMAATSRPAAPEVSDTLRVAPSAQPMRAPSPTATPVAAKKGGSGALIGLGAATLVAIGGGTAYFLLAANQPSPPVPAEPKTIVATTVPPVPATRPPEEPVSQPSSPQSSNAPPPPPVSTPSATAPPATPPPVTPPPTSVPTVTATVVTPPAATSPAMKPATAPATPPPLVAPSSPQAVAPTTPPPITATTSPATPPVTEPAMTTPIPAEPSHPSAAAIRQTLAGIIADASCTLASADDIDKGEVVVTGLASTTAAAALRRAVESAASGAPVKWQVSAFSGLYCNAVDAIRPVAGRGAGLAAAPNRTHLRDNELLTVQTTLPDFPAHLIIDYLSSDGSVTHLVPTTSDVTDHAYPDRLFPAHSHQLFGEPIPPKYSGMRVGSPFGTDMIVVIASQTSLLSPRKNQSEDKADSYSAELQAAIEAARRRGTHVAATAFLLDIAPKP